MITVKDYTDDKGQVFTPVIRASKLREFLDAANKAFPTWTFVVEAGGGGFFRTKDEDGNETTGYECRIIKVLTSKGEELGEMYTLAWSDTGYVIDNERIKMMRERGNGIKSGSLDKIIKQMKKYFTDLTLPEKLSRQFTNAEYHLEAVARDARHLSGRALSRVADAVRDLLTHDYAHTKEVLANAHLKDEAREYLDNIPALKEEVDQKSALVRGYNGTTEAGRRASFVLIDNGKYYFVRKDDKEHPVIRDTDELGADVRQSLGMLKLMENGAFIPNRGLKVNETTFFVFDDLPIKETNEQASDDK